MEHPGIAENMKMMYSSTHDREKICWFDVIKGTQEPYHQAINGKMMCIYIYIKLVFFYL